MVVRSTQAASSTPTFTVIYDTGAEGVLGPKLRKEYGSYELEPAAIYLRTLAAQLRRNADRRL